ncbi:MAG: endonuclease/exonuclease/phosphatase family protein [Prevotella sp.]|nr:endonuclease/exonuclease/phosphatase family protein [Prevotella sp.]
MMTFALSMMLGLVSSSAMAQQMLVGSYNIRYKNSGDSIQGDLWAKRCQVICDQVNFMSPDIFGAQEVLHNQLTDMLSRLDGYSYIGVGRDDGKTAGEYAAIFYKNDRLQLLDQGNFWLSETPDVPGLGWDAACVRVCTWGKFAPIDRGASSEIFYFFNLHMDHVGVTARREAAKLVVKIIREIAAPEALVFLTGDFNVDQNDEIYRIFTDSGILKDSYECARLRFAENGTFNSFKSELFTQSRIDHVFVSPQANVEAYGVLTDCYWVPEEASAQQLKSSDAPQEISFSRYQRRLPSDHYPVFVRLK